MRKPFVVCLALAAACAAPKPVEKQPWRRAAGSAQAPAPAPARPAAAVAPAAAAMPAAPAPAPAADAARQLETSPASWASRFASAVDCEAAARALRAAEPDRGWRALRACAGRGDLRTFARLTDGFWDADLRTRPDAVLVLGAVLAARGGDLGNDLTVLKKRRIPLFGLDSASSHPDIYKGRPVVFLARVDEVTPAKGRAVARLAEVSLVSRGRDIVTSSPSYTSSSMPALDDHGRAMPAAQSSSSTTYTYSTRYDNELDETGVEIVGQLSKLDPFFEPGRNFLVVGRFDGLRDSPELASGTSPVVSVYAYYEVAAHSMME